MITFDGPNAAIYLSLGTTTLDVVDLYSRWKDWVQQGDNSKFPIAFTSVGGDPVDASAGTSIPAYIYLENGWHIHPQAANHTLDVVGGVLLVQGGGDPFEDIPGYTIRVKYQQPVQAITVSTGGGSGASAADVWAYATRTLTGGVPTAEQVAAATWQRAIEGGMSAEELVRIMLAALTGKTTGIGTPTEHYRDAADTKDRVTATFDANGNRITVAVDGA